MIIVLEIDTFKAEMVLSPLGLEVREAPWHLTEGGRISFGLNVAFALSPLSGLSLPKQIFVIRFSFFGHQIVL